jgi:hypothetical protein
MKWWTRAFYLVVGAVSATFGIFFCFVVARHPVHFWKVAGIYGLMDAASIPAFLATGVSMLVKALRSRLVINGTRIELCGLILERTADLSEIEGFRTVNSGFGDSIQLCLRDGRSKIIISHSIDTDDDFRAWLQQLPDLDKRDRKGNARA